MTGLEIVQRIVEFAEARFAPASGPAADLAEAWLAHVIETARAALVLYEHGHGDVAAPLRRSVMEHALWLSWVTRHQDIAWATVHAKRRQAVVAKEKELRDWADWTPAAVDAVKKTPVRPVPTVRQLIEDLVAAERAERPDQQTTHDGWFVAYWSDSESSHPSLSTAAQHRDDVPQEEMLGSTLLLALSAYSTLLAGDPWSEDLDAFAAELVESVRAGR